MEEKDEEDREMEKEVFFHSPHSQPHSSEEEFLPSMFAGFEGAFFAGLLSFLSWAEIENGGEN